MNDNNEQQVVNNSNEQQQRQMTMNNNGDEQQWTTMATNNNEQQWQWMEHTADEHVLAFRKAAQSSSYGGEALIEEFKRLLNSRLHKCISNLDNVPETINGWYKQAMCLDRQWRRAKQEADYYNRMTNNVCTTQPWNNVGQYNNKPVVPTVPARDLNVMDVDEQQQQQTVGQGQSQQQRPPLICFKCWKPGHLVHNCRLKVDIRAMMYKELVVAIKSEEQEKEAKKDFPTESK